MKHDGRHSSCLLIKTEHLWKLKALKFNRVGKKKRRKLERPDRNMMIAKIEYIVYIRIDCIFTMIKKKVESTYDIVHTFHRYTSLPRYFSSTIQHSIKKTERKPVPYISNLIRSQKRRANFSLFDSF